MQDTQYSLFLELDRHYVAGGRQLEDCCAAVRQKRASIESELNRHNPVAREVIEDRTTFVDIYRSYSAGYRGFRRMLPRAHDAAHNERLAYFGRIVPNVRHFVRRSVLAVDNPITCTFYGIAAAVTILAVWIYAGSNDPDTAFTLETDAILPLVLLGGAGGFILGLLAMVRYRTRDQNIIHAREAAAYMDLNYKCHRTCDDKSWATIIALKSAPSTAGARSATATAPPPASNPATTR